MSYKKPKVSDLTEAERKAQRNVINTVLDCAGHCMAVIMELDEAWPIADGEYIDLRLSMNAYSIFMTYHKAMCQIKNGTGNIKDQIADAKTYSCKAGEEKSWGTLKPLLADVFVKHGLSYTAPKVGTCENWIGVASSYLNSFLAFKHRLTEIHLGRTKWQVNIVDGVPKYRTLSDYGMEPKHEILCEGITFPPYMKSPLISSLGPGALMAYYIDNKEKQETKYKTKIRAELLHCLSVVPKIEEIMHCIDGASASAVKSIVNALMNFLLVSGFRAKNRAYFPPCVLLMKDVGYKTLGRDISERVVLATGGSAFKVPDFVRTMDMTGSGMWRLYHHMIPVSVPYGAFAKEILTHAILGTDKENFNLLELVTGVVFHTRAEMGPIFKDQAKQQGNATKPIPFKVLCKMATANTTPGLYPQNIALTNVVVLGGKRKYHESEALKDFVESLSGGNTSYSIANAQMAVNYLNSEAQANAVKLRSMEIRGTTDWYAKHTVTLTYVDETGALTPLAEGLAAEGGKYFHSN